jgi:HlyD family secretion protein
LVQKPITIGSNDGINIQVVKGLNGTENIVTSLEIQEETVAKSDSESGDSPFMPKRPEVIKKQIVKVLTKIRLRKLKISI